MPPQAHRVAHQKMNLRLGAAAAAAAANAASTTLARAEAVLSAANESAMRAEAAASDARATFDAQTRRRQSGNNGGERKPVGSIDSHGRREGRKSERGCRKRLWLLLWPRCLRPCQHSAMRQAIRNSWQIGKRRVRSRTIVRAHAEGGSTRTRGCARSTFFQTARELESCRRACRKGAPLLNESRGSRCESTRNLAPCVIALNRCLLLPRRTKHTTTPPEKWRRKRWW